MTTRRVPARGAVPAILLALLLAGCGTGGSVGGTTNGADGRSSAGKGTSGAAATLASRPTFEAAETDYLALLDEARQAVVATSPQVTFAGVPTRADETLCKAPFDTVEGRRSGLYRIDGQGQGAISDDEWPAALAAVTTVARAHGFGEPKAIKDEPGEHQVAFYGRYDEELSFGTKVNTTLGIYGACFLLAASHPSPGTTAQ